MRELTLHDVKAAVRGGSVFASGGGGWVDHGLEIGETAVKIGKPKLACIDEVDENDVVITVSAIGAPAAKDWQMLAADYIKAVRLLQDAYGKKIVGMMTPQNGCSSSINGWVQAAALDLLVIDAVGDLRAHPTGKMGSMGLSNNLSYETIQVVVGGKRETGSYLELVVRGTAAKTSNILRVASEQSGSFIACARHPVTAKFIKENAVLGGISKAISLGEAMLKAEPNGAEAVIDAICRTTNGELVGKGKIVNVDYETKGAFDIGKCIVKTDKTDLTLHIMNEYMAVDDSSGARLSTYPDVIAVLSLETGLPVNVAQLEKDMPVGVFAINKKHFDLSSSVKDPTVYPEVETALGINISEYALS